MRVLQRMSGAPVSINGVEVKTSGPSEPVTVLGDRDELIRALENLVENALKYGESGKRVDVTLNIQQERVARAGFIGSGISRNNRLIERHDSIHGAYWRTYDFDAIPQNLIDRDILLPDRRNLFAYPLGPGGTNLPSRAARI